MCLAFSKVVDLAANNEGRARAIMDWIKSQATELRTTRSSCGSNSLIQQSVHLATQCTTSQNIACVSILDPKLSNRKGPPRKLRKKGPLESTMKKAKASSKSGKGRRPREKHSGMEFIALDVQPSQQLQHSQPTPFSYSQLLLATSKVNCVHNNYLHLISSHRRLLMLYSIHKGRTLLTRRYYIRKPQLME